MNFLAHLYLSSDEPDALAGSLLPDLARGPLPAGASQTLASACRLHRLVDAFTDTHPLHARSRGRIREHHGRYAGILVDIFYDHILARDWPRYSDEPLGAFTQRVYAALAGRRDQLPEAMRQPLEMMIREDWLQSYATPSGIHAILIRMEKRFSRRFDRPVELASAVTDMVAHDAGLSADFHAFFPQLIRYACSKEPTVSRRRKFPSEIRGEIPGE